MNQLIIVFGIALFLYILYSSIEKRHRILEYNLINSMQLLSASLKRGDSLETALHEESRGKDSASHLYKSILKRMNKGDSISQAFTHFSKTRASYVLNCLSELVSVYEFSSEDISKQLDNLGRRLTELLKIEEELYSKTDTPVMVIQVLGLLVAPIFIIFIPTILGLPVYDYFYYYMLIMITTLGSLDYFFYGDLVKSIFLFPVFITGFLIVTELLTPTLIGLFSTII